jgi:hypothetical protein
MTNVVDENFKKSGEKVLRLIEKVINLNGLDRQHHRDEVEKHWSFMLQYKDMLDIYEIRRAGIVDEEWEKAKNEFFEIRRKLEAQ